MISCAGSQPARSQDPNGGSAPSTRSSCSAPISLAPVPYEGQDGIRALMQELIGRYGWMPIKEGDNVIALKRPDGETGGTISLEPGGQFELSGAPLETLHETAAETHEHLREVIDVGEDLGIGFLGIGFSPEVDARPKRRTCRRSAIR